MSLYGGAPLGSVRAYRVIHPDAVSEFNAKTQRRKEAKRSRRASWSLSLLFCAFAPLRLCVEILSYQDLSSTAVHRTTSSAKRLDFRGALVFPHPHGRGLHDQDHR